MKNIWVIIWLSTEKQITIVKNKDYQEDNKSHNFGLLFGWFCGLWYIRNDDSKFGEIVSRNLLIFDLRLF